MPHRDPSPLRARPALRAGALALLVALATACAGAQKPPARDVEWPGPPNKPRLKYVRSLRGSEQFDERFWTKVNRSIIGGGEDYVVFNPNSVALSVDETRLYVQNIVGWILEFDFAKKSVRMVANEENHVPLRPYALAVDGADNLYVTDQTGSVYVYSADNRFIREIGRGLLRRATGIAIDRRRQIVYVADAGERGSDRHVVEVFAQDGRHLRTMGTKGVDPGQFLYPTFATVSPEGNLYVADTMNSRVQVFDPDGNVIGIIGAAGDAAGQFGKPKGVAFDGAGNLHVVDGQTGWVQIFNRKHQLLMGYGGQFAGQEYLKLPNGIAIDSKNHIYVADYASNQVNEYLLYDTSDPEGETSSQPKTPAASPAPGAPQPVSAPASQRPNEGGR